MLTLKLVGSKVFTDELTCLRRGTGNVLLSRWKLESLMLFGTSLRIYVPNSIVFSLCPPTNVL